MEQCDASECLLLFREYQSKNQAIFDIKANQTDESARMIRNIVNNLGGIDSIIELCLTNDEYCQQNIEMKTLII